MKTSHSDTVVMPLVVDLDGTLITNDVTRLSVQRFLGVTSLAELMLLPVRGVMFLWWYLCGGWPHAKAEIATRVDLTVQDIHFNTEFTCYLEEQKQAGRKCVLATASHMRYARFVSTLLPGIFDDIIASCGQTLCRGPVKRQCLVDEYGFKQFVYAGNALTDVAVWQAAAEVIVVRPHKHVLTKLRHLAIEIQRLFD